MEMPEFARREIFHNGLMKYHRNTEAQNYGSKNSFCDSVVRLREGESFRYKPGISYTRGLSPNSLSLSLRKVKNKERERMKERFKNKGKNRFTSPFSRGS